MNVIIKGTKRKIMDGLNICKILDMALITDKIKSVDRVGSILYILFDGLQCHL